MPRIARLRSWPVVTAALVVLTGAGVLLANRPAPAPAASTHPRSPPSTATSTSGRASASMRPATLQDSVGVLFRRGANGSLTQTCTAVVVDSTTHDVVATAAHCLVAGATMVFAPGYRDQSAPHGMWTVTSSHTDPTWQDHGDEDDDYAFLTVRSDSAATRTVPVQVVVGGLPMGLSPRAGQLVLVRGYPIKLGGRPLTCRATVRTTREFPTVDCVGFSAGTSGGPLVAAADQATGATLVGLIGGLETGGCTDDVSYTSPFTTAARTVLVAAEQHGPSSPAPRTLSTTPC